MTVNRFRAKLAQHDLDDFVTTAEIITNSSMRPDPDGRPAMSWEFRVRYSENAPGDIDDRVAWVIANTIFAGWLAFGRTWTKTVDIGYGSSVDVGLTVLD